MATQTVPFRERHQAVVDLDVVRERFKTHDGLDRPQRRNKLRASHNCLQDSERIFGICAAVKLALDFLGRAKLGDSAFSFWDGTGHLETRAALEFAAQELEFLREQLDKENLALRGEVDRVSMFEEIVGTSPSLQAVLSRVIKVAATDSTVLITGETGTGKELVARAIHRGSDRASRPFVGVNCAAIPRDLIASELFGHEKGAFTGATQQRLGRFELASGGTIFLDEVGELPTETQIALLRVLQEHEFDRVGGTRPMRTDVRVIAATNRDLQAAISTGSFRGDLFYRLHVFPIDIPSLRATKTGHSSAGGVLYRSLCAKSEQALQEGREENASSTPVISLARKYPRITERYRTFGDPLRVRHILDRRKLVTTAACGNRIEPPH